MKIGLDGKRAVKNLTGLGNYSRLVVESLAMQFPDDRFLLYTPDISENPRLKNIISLPNVSFRTPSGKSMMQRGSLWRTFGMTECFAADKIDIYHGLSNELPLNIRKSGIPSVVTIHDVIYRRMKECYSLTDRKLYDFKYGSSCRNADRIIAVSERTKKDIIEFYGISPRKIDVVYQGCDASFREMPTPTMMAAVKNRYQLPDRFILQVGTIEKRKNLELTVRALSALPEDVKLVAVGRDRGYLAHVATVAKECGVNGRIKVLTKVPMAELPALYRQASVVVYPSFYEGFGIPILEALECGRPVVAATGSCLEEAGGDAAYYVSPTSPREMANALKATLSGGPEIVSRIARGKIHASRFDNAEIASRIAEVYRKVLKKQPLPKL